MLDWTPPVIMSGLQCPKQLYRVRGSWKIFRGSVDRALPWFSFTQQISAVSGQGADFLGFLTPKPALVWNSGFTPTLSCLISCKHKERRNKLAIIVSKRISKMLKQSLKDKQRIFPIKRDLIIKTSTVFIYSVGSSKTKENVIFVSNSIKTS